MGYLGDLLSRNQAFIITLMISSLSAFLSAIAPTGDPSKQYTTIIIFRFFLGIGIGGVYPLSAVKVILTLTLTLTPNLTLTLILIVIPTLTEGI